MKRTVLTFGALAGGIIFGYSYILFLIFGKISNPSQLETAQWAGYIRYLVLLLGVIMAMVAYRRGTAGMVGYGRLLAVGVLVTLVTAVFVGVMEYTYVAFANPEFYQQYSRMTLEALQAKGATAVELANARRDHEQYAWMANPVMTGLFYFVETAVIGSVLSLIAALFMRREGSAPRGGGPLLDQPA